MTNEKPKISFEQYLMAVEARAKEVLHNFSLEQETLAANPDATPEEIAAFTGSCENIRQDQKTIIHLVRCVKAISHELTALRQSGLVGPDGKPIIF